MDKIINKLKKKRSARLLPSNEAYRLWSSTYDDQPDNVILYLEGKLFSEIIVKDVIKDKNVLDIGCGTGRHWKELLEHKPRKITGIDTSQEMIEKLKTKFPEAEVYLSVNNSLKNIESDAYDIIISTLTLGHINKPENYLKEWNRVLRSGGEI